MTCGHLISSVGMEVHLFSLIKSQKYMIKCPYDDDGEEEVCDEEWKMIDCKKVA